MGKNKHNTSKMFLAKQRIKQSAGGFHLYNIDNFCNVKSFDEKKEDFYFFGHPAPKVMSLYYFKHLDERRIIDKVRENPEALALG